MSYRIKEQNGEFQPQLYYEAICTPFFYTPSAEVNLGEPKETLDQAKLCLALHIHRINKNKPIYHHYP